MKIYHGIHFYININNLNKIVKKDEYNHEDLTRSFHATNTFIRSVEEFALNLGDIVIEKFTTSRLHFYTTSCDDKIIIKIMQVICFANALTKYMHSDIGKYAKMEEFAIGAGADIGEFTEFEFSDTAEMTTIGSPANRAAKLQSYCDDDNILISKNLFDILPDDIRDVFYGDGRTSAKLASKYADLTAYKSNYKEVEEILPDRYFDRKDKNLEFAKDFANDTNFGEINFSDTRTKVSFEGLSLINSKHIDDAAVLYADIRGFTNKVDEERLSDIHQLTQRVLSGMNKAVVKEDGVHVQFQGDRESALFHQFSNESNNYAMRAFFSALRMVDMVAEINTTKYDDKLNIGIGISLGDVFATRVGLKFHKDNVLMGETVKQADTAEDEVAGANPQNSKTEIVLTAAFYDYLLREQKQYYEQFQQVLSLRKHGNELYYVCAIGLKDFRKLLYNHEVTSNASIAKKDGNLRPWSKLNR